MRALLPLLLSVAACAPAAQQTVPDTGATTTVFVVRHAEKAPEPKADPPLTAAGTSRAEALVEVLGAVKVTAVLSTDFARTRSTAAPLAARLGLTTELVDARAPDHARVVADGLLSRHRGGTVVVVGHSNTAPDIVAALGAPRPAEICEGEYDNLYVVQVPVTGPATIERRKYGARTEDESCRTRPPSP